MKRNDVFMNSIEKKTDTWPIQPVYLLLFITLMGATLRLYMVFTAAGMNSDAWIYGLTVRKMWNEGMVAGMRGDFFWPYRPINRQNMLYPFISSWFMPITGDALLSLRLTSALAAIGLIPLAYAIADRLFDRKGIALMAALLLAIHSEFARASAAVYREVLMAFLVTLALYCVIRIIQDNNNWSYLWAALCGTVIFSAVLTRPEAPAFFGACCLIVLFLGRPLPWKKRICTLFAMGIVFCMLEAPLVLWMHRETGVWAWSQWDAARKLSSSIHLKRHFEARRRNEDDN